jgi:hypothetical protein
VFYSTLSGCDGAENGIVSSGNGRVKSGFESLFLLSFERLVVNAAIEGSNLDCGHRVILGARPMLLPKFFFPNLYDEFVDVLRSL